MKRFTSYLAVLALLPMLAPLSFAGECVSSVRSVKAVKKIKVAAVAVPVYVPVLVASYSAAIVHAPAVQYQVTYTPPPPPPPPPVQATVYAVPRVQAPAYAPAPPYAPAPSCPAPVQATGPSCPVTGNPAPAGYGARAGANDARLTEALLRLESRLGQLEARLNGNTGNSYPQRQDRLPAPNNTQGQEVEVDVGAILNNRCASCHEGSVAQRHGGGFTLMTGGVLAQLSGPDLDKVGRSIQSDSMPKNGPPLSAQDKQAIFAWIDGLK